ncbi:MauE/DoxX family redox-associated membrane protein [Sphingobacterium hotanense]|uniref:MauE/DoxX family redox-associated membrane protein n=1 Tax=Sphingobacterium TaxID=28453 RepID=UPI0021A70C77|nr:MauE/DoxX family redox-associated membrane protein [Sphingobacterium hotanense]MCT1523665.1 hypothetical protein [Sphingobacterium hotanense]
MKTNNNIIIIAQYSFIVLWGYAAITKLYNWKLSRAEMHMQIFPSWVGDILFWLIPLAELFLIYLLLDRDKKPIGLKLSTILMGLFTLYLLIGVTGLLGEPCVCAGILKDKSAVFHIIFNMIFIILGVTALVLAYKGRIEKEVIFGYGRKEGSNQT